MKQLAKAALCGAYKYSGAMFLQERLAAWRGRAFVPIILFHRVTDDIPADGLTVSTAWFRRFCRLVQRSFHAVTLNQTLDWLDGRIALPRRSVAITFDDCYRDNLPAARVLAEHGLPATFFIPSAYVGTDHVFPWDAGLPRLPNLTWDDVHEIVRLGHDIGSHTVHHANMAELDAEQAEFELRESRGVIEARLQRPVRYFAYPYGGRGNLRPDQLGRVEAAGYRACFSAHGGFVTADQRGQVLPREAAPPFRSLLNLELHLAGCLDWMYAFKRKVGLVGPGRRMGPEAPGTMPASPNAIPDRTGTESYPTAPDPA